MSQDCPLSPARDLEVLPHLRGFPEDLARFSNLLKQAHPRGRSAIGLIIHRAGPARFLRRVCEAVARGEAILTTYEAATLLGLSAEELLRRLEAGELPEPVYREGRKLVWRREQLLGA
ncbi:MAG: hypothetical protein QN172_09730 [Armatimonadota bacterium]|nr:hypothetical protein [Armatimonadota bacterium]MDR7440281.1 hypothetical protein [Armatimonadota bacterium]MDR7563938.1 hypothetical protein [Armatimonadota bacterium]MDR7568942.1 hypothetical protein [Armatimonadota bacterium]MDR7602720.1 hypothetical protein [Armatimonadota bacterium]